MRISVLFFIVTIPSLCVIIGLCGIVGSEPLAVDILEEAAILHGVIGFGVKLARALQGIVVVILVIVATSWLLNRVDFMIVLEGTLAYEGVAAVTPSVMVVLVVVVIVAPIMTIVVVVPTMVFTVVIMTQWVFGA
jgi:hypothetical protein